MYFQKLILFPLLCIVIFPCLVVVRVLGVISNSWGWLVYFWVYYTYKDGHLFEPMSCFDQWSGYTLYSNLITYTLKTDSFIDIQQLRMQFHQTFLAEDKTDKFLVFRYRRKILFGMSYKVALPPCKINLEYHIREIECPVTQDESEFIGNQINDLKQTSTWGIPNWELILVHFPNEGRTTLLFRLSHWLGDATSCRYLIDHLTGNETTYRIPKAGIPLSLYSKVKQLMPRV